MHILRAGHYTRMPWKNGGGETTEMAVYPADASVENFAWRVSMATVASDGPFSLFPGVDRTLSVLEGEGMVLAIGDSAPVTLTPASAPLSFPADVPTSARLVAGPITDLNVMTRRGSFTHHVERHEVDGILHLKVGTGLLFCASGDLKPAGAATLEPHDTVVLDGSETTIAIEGRGRLFAIRIERKELRLPPEPDGHRARAATDR